MRQFQASSGTPATPVKKAGWRACVAQFRREEDGVMVGFAIILVIMMVMIGGIGADIMLAEMRRTQLQHTLDRAVLAAADLDQTRGAEEVVADYFEKAGVEHSLNEVVVSQSLTHRRVSATAAISSQLAYSTVGRDFKALMPSKPSSKTYTSGEVAALEAQLPDREAITIAASGIAEENIGNVEISLVLDVSGSMGSNSRLVNLKTAAQDFIQTMADNTEDDTMSISIVPYSAQVSVPDTVMAELQTNGENPVANCLNFDAADYDDTAISTTQTYDRTLHFTWSGDEYDNRYNNNVVSDSYIDCRQESSRELAILQNDVDALKNYVESFFAQGNTSIDVGMKWGTALLDPAFQPLVANLMDLSDDNTGVVSNVFEGRPYDYGTSDSLKIVVLMSDGQNTRQHYITDGYREGESNVWYNAQEDFYSIYLGQDVEDDDGDGNYDEPIYFWPSDDVYRDHAYGEGSYEETETVDSDECRAYRKNGSCRRYYKIEKTVVVNEPGSAEVITYPDLWAYTTPKYVADEIYGPLMGQDPARNEWYYPVVDDVSYGTKDTRTRDICDAAKDAGIIVYTIGFEAPDAAVVVLQDCASSDSHYFDVDGLEIQDAFAAIATSIRQLRLIQ